jgi:hypothetical protein
LTIGLRDAKQFRNTSAQILKTFPNNLHSLSIPIGARANPAHLAITCGEAVADGRWSL